jgi:beta-carotene 3-hydroxylase
VAAAAFAAMEPIAALLHRRLMHGAGWGLHRSHHVPARPGVEANDAYPLLIAAATASAMLAGRLRPRLRPLLWIGSGLTAYGAAYLVVHDLLVHERLGRLPLSSCRYTRWVAGAHARHHRDAGPPYGFIAPVVARARRGVAPAGVRRPINAKAATRILVESGTVARTENTS